MLIPIAYTGQDNREMYIVIFWIIILLSWFFYKKAKNASPTTSLEAYKISEQVRKEKKKKLSIENDILIASTPFTYQA